ncbi:MAG: hypothetical protein F6K19_30430 [Cyanothece sp. SIO1E1]|nr:hypothetical protein [Cyanothece sp. SIO1E1]
MATELYWLNQIQPSEHSLIGDKAFYLSTLMRKGYPAISGFVVAAPVFQDFLETINWLEPLFADLPNSSLHLDVDNPQQLQAIAQQIRQAIVATPLSQSLISAIGEAVATFKTPTAILRPSFTLKSSSDPALSFKTAGLLEAKVCWSELEMVTTRLKQVWAELFRAKSLFYWRRLGIQLQEINLAVLVQPLAAATASGLVQIDATHLEIQSTQGLGMALARGEAIPDYYQASVASGIVQRQWPGRQTQIYQINELTAESVPSSTQKDCLRVEPVWETASQKFSLNSAQLQELIQLTRRVFTDLGFALALEWTICELPKQADPKIYLVQVSPQIPKSRMTESTRPSPISPRSGLSSGINTVETAIKADSHQTTDLIVRGLAASPGQTIAPIARVSDPQVDLDQLTSGSIWVATTIPLDWLPWLKQAAGIVLEQGSVTCHSAIIARELGIPAIVSATDATRLVQAGEWVLLDGDRGEVYRAHQPTAAVLPDVSAQSSAGVGSIQQQLKHWITPTADAVRQPIATQLLVNLSQTSSLNQVCDLPIDGIGLLRSELMVLDILEHQHPALWLQQGKQAELVERMAACICEFARAVAPRPVMYRSLDLRSHEFPNLTGTPVVETNPMLGLRGTLSYQANPVLFQAELAALAQVQQQGHTNINLLLPFVRSVGEFAFCRQQIEQAGLTQLPEFQLWIMAEVPSVLLLLPDYVKAGVQGISIGTNDLTQLLLGVDRDQTPLSATLNERHPAVMRAMAQLIRLAHQAGIPCSICGQAIALYPDLIEPLIRWGITSISVEPDAVESTYEAIARAEKRLLLEAIRQRVT